MPWLDQTSGGLPSPESWGPPARQLQQDILDELSDHLDCALSRELRETNDGDEASAREQVLTKFGNPRKLARSLWLAAMKEQVMSNRIMMGTNIVLAIVVVAICVFTISAMQRNNDVTEALLAKLETFATTPASDTQSEWGSVTIQMFTGSQDISPEDFYVQIGGHPFSGELRESITEYFDAQGIVTFGRIRAGTYSLFTMSPLGEWNSQNLTLYPGDKPNVEIYYHKPAIMKEQVSFKLMVPSDIKDYLSYTLIEIHDGVFNSEGLPENLWRSRDTLQILLRSDGLAAKVGSDTDFISYQDQNTIKIDPTVIAFSGSIELDMSQQYKLYVKSVFLCDELYTGPLSDVPSADYQAEAGYRRRNNRSSQVTSQKADFQRHESQSMNSLQVELALSETLLDDLRRDIRNARNREQQRKRASEKSVKP